jgi:hypothetical protein
MPKRRTASRRSGKRRMVRRRPSRRRTSRRKPNRRRTAKGLESWLRKKLLNQYSPGEYISGRKYHGPPNLSHEAEMRDVEKFEALQRDNTAMNVFPRDMKGESSKKMRKHWTEV